VTSRYIDTQSDPSKKTVFNSITKVGILKEWVRVRVLGLVLDDMVIGVLCDSNSAGIVGIGSLNGVDKFLVKKQLANVRDMPTSEGVIGQHVSICVRDNVDMGSSARVVTREQSLELGNALGIGLLNTTQESLVQV
jgi:hypothetical protein